MEKISKKDAFWGALNLLGAQPKLFVPKIIIAILYGVMTLISAYLVAEAILIQANPAILQSADYVSYLMIFTLAFLVFSIFIYFLDVFFSGLYPILVKDAKKGKVSFLSAFSQLKGKYVKLFISGIVIFVLLAITSIIDSVFLIAFGFGVESVLVSFVLAFVLIFLLYFLFPIVAFEQKSVHGTIRETFYSAFRNKSVVLIFSVVPFSITAIKFAIAYFSTSVEMFLVFWILVLLTGIIYSIHAVVNQILYEGVVEGKVSFKARKHLKK